MHILPINLKTKTFLGTLSARTDIIQSDAFCGVHYPLGHQAVDIFGRLAYVILP